MEAQTAVRTESLKELKEISDFEMEQPQVVLKWAINQFYPDIALACSFGAEDVALVDMIVKINPDTKVFYIDTNLLFKKTYEVIDRIVEKYKPNFIKYEPLLTVEEQASKYGDRLYEREPDLCCNLRKVEPLKRVLNGLTAWITGVRREQCPTRANIGIVEEDRKFNLIKINPLATWTSKDVWNYIRENDVPYNLLHERGYPSIGCEPCTQQVKPGEDPRAGRWKYHAKTECGLHK